MRNKSCVSAILGNREHQNLTNTFREQGRLDYRPLFGKLTRSPSPPRKDSSRCREQRPDSRLEILLGTMEHGSLWEGLTFLVTKFVGQQQEGARSSSISYLFSDVNVRCRCLQQTATFTVRLRGLLFVGKGSFKYREHSEMSFFPG